jgi:hypothetical protein
VFSGPNHAVIIILCTVDGVALEKFLFALLLVVEIMLTFHIVTSYTSIKGNATFGPLSMEDIDKYMKPICTIKSNGLNSPKGGLNGPCNTSTSTTASTITNFSFSGRSTERSKKRMRGTESQEVEQDPKKPRIIWAGELHKKFLEACDKLIAAGESNIANHFQALR